jgi:hypothetical protein
MLSLERCRKVLGSDTKLSDEDLATLRDQLYCLASLTLELRDHQKKSTLKKPDGDLIDRDALEERAAIIEFEGNVSRDEAERNAVALALENDHLN